MLLDNGTFISLSGFTFKMDEDIRGIIFDLNGTLGRYERTPRSYLRLQRNLNLPIEDKKRFKHLILTKNYENISELVRDLNSKLEIDEADFNKELDDEIKSFTLYPETLDVLNELISRNIGLMVISNIATPYKAAFYDSGLSKLIESPIFSCDVGFKKYDKEIYLLALKRLDLQPEEVLMIGDDLRNDVLGPQNTGIRGILLDRYGRREYHDKITSLKELL